MTKEKFLERKKRIGKMLKVLHTLVPHPKIALHFKNPWELLVAVVLSAQCTDKKVNEVTPALFKRYKKIGEYVNANPKEFEIYIKPTGFYRNKAKNILAAAKFVKEKFKGKVPKTMAEMLLIPGVGRKSANVILGNAYGIVEGIAVDTHVGRLAQKFNLTDSKDPVKIERDLMEIVPKKEWFHFTYQLIDYGRHFCVRRKHECANHTLSKIYPPAAHRWF